MRQFLPRYVQHTATPLFVSSVLFTVEATSGKDGIKISTNIRGERRIYMAQTMSDTSSSLD
jgi:hypothetical protein